MFIITVLVLSRGQETLDYARIEGSRDEERSKCSITLRDGKLDRSFQLLLTFSILPIDDLARVDV